MQHAKFAIGLALVGLLGGCTGVYYVSGAAATPDDGIYRLMLGPNVGPTGPLYAGARDPHVGSDGALYFARQDANGVFQIHRNGVRVTSSPGNKRNPAFSNGRLAYAVDDAASPTGKTVGLKEMPAGPETLLPYPVDGGLDFFDDGRKLLFLLPAGVHWASLSPLGPPTPVVACPQSVASGCIGPVVSHDQQRMAFVSYVTFGAGVQATIQVHQVGTWSLVTSIPKDALCPTCTFGQPGYIDRLGTFDFSPDDEWLYVSASTRSAPGVTPASVSELYQIKADGTAPRRLTDNSVPDHHPSTKRCVWFGC